LHRTWETEVRLSTVLVVVLAAVVFGNALGAPPGAGSGFTAPLVSRIANPGADSEEIRVRATRAADGEAVRVAVALVLPLDPDVVWAVLNDFEDMPGFVPDIRAARLISSGPGRKRVKIEGVARFLFLAFPIDTTLDVAYRPDRAMAIDSVAGNLAIHGVVQVHGDGPYTRVDYQARLTPSFWLPPLIGDFLIGRQIRRQFEGMVAEMHRRAAGAAPLTRTSATPAEAA
jgi:carbon monoxide dehydrogenase subunit G